MRAIDRPPKHRRLKLNKFKVLRILEDRGWRQFHLAEEMGVHESRVSRWLAGQAPMSKYQKQLIEILGDDIYEQESEQ